jgi:membrane protease YdiL (CAAX protease family)
MTILLTAEGTGSETGNGGEAPQSRARSLPAVLTFFVLTFAWSWGLGVAATQTKAWSEVLATDLLMAATFGPSLAGLAVVAFFSRRQGFRAWLGRCLNWRTGWHWYALAFLVPPGAMVCALVVNTALGGATPVLPGADKLPLVIINFGLVLLVGGPLGEEFGWRGFALPALTARLGWRAASLIIGVVWAAWHLPLFFMAGTAQAQMPIALFMINITASSVAFSWLFARSGRSVWPVIVGHTSLNFWAGLLILPLGAGSQAYALVTALVVLIALALLVRGDGLKAKAPC